MPAGDYIASSLVGEYTFSLPGDGWTLVADVPEILSLRAGDQWLAFMSGEIRLRQGDEVEMTSKAGRAMKVIESFPGISVSAVDAPVQVGGRDAVVFDVSNAGKETTMLFGLGNTSGMYLLDPGASVRMIWTDVDGTPFVVALEAPTQSFESFLAGAQPIVDSVRFA